MVLDIGAGKGFITVHLAQHCSRVIAIENDKSLLELLRKRFSGNSTVQVVGSDFRNYKIPDSGFKVVSNIPYGLTSDILKSLMFTHVEHFWGGSLIMQLEPARKLFSDNTFNPYTVFYHTFFDLELMYEIGPESFIPPPKVKSALLRIRRKVPISDTGFEMKEEYLDFLFFVLQKPDLPARTVLKKLFRKSQVREVSEKYGISPDKKVVHLSAEQWFGCFIEMLAKVPERYHPRQFLKLKVFSSYQQIRIFTALHGEMAEWLKAASC